MTTTTETTPAAPAVESTANPHPLAAIESRYTPPTNYRGSRVRVMSQHTIGRRFYDWQHDLNTDENHAAAVALYLAEIKKANGADSRGWGTLGNYAHGVLADQTHVFVSIRNPYAQ